MPQQRTKEESERLRGEREIISGLSILDLKDGKLYDSGKQEEGRLLNVRYFYLLSTTKRLIGLCIGESKNERPT